MHPMQQAFGTARPAMRVLHTGMVMAAVSILRRTQPTEADVREGLEAPRRCTGYHTSSTRSGRGEEQNVIPAAFDYVRAGSAEEAIALLGEHGDDAKLLAGGHSLLPLMKLRLAQPSVLIDVGRLRDLSYVRDGGDHVAVGALTRHHDLHTSDVLKASAPLLAHSAGQVGDPQVRHRGTIGVSVAHGDPASDLPAVLLAYDATFVARGPSGERTIGAADFFQGFLETALAPDECSRDPGAEARRRLVVPEVQPARPGLGHRRRRRLGGRRQRVGRTREHGLDAGTRVGDRSGHRIGRFDRRCRGARRRRSRSARRSQRVAGIPAPPGDRACTQGARRSNCLAPRTLYVVVAPNSPDAVADALAAHDYLVDSGLATAIFLAMTLPRPLLLEGEAGVGKTEVARVLSRWTGGELLRLQCYEGIDAGQAMYEWDYSRQLLHLRAVEATGGSLSAAEDELYSERFLVHRPLLRAVTAAAGTPPPVLLIDEIDRADDEFEALLLEVLSEYAVTVPEIGTFRATVPPIVVVTSNRTRDVHDALKRRCLYHWVEHPDFEREVAIIGPRARPRWRGPARSGAAVEAMRELDLYKPPGLPSTIDWPRPRRPGRTALDPTRSTRPRQRVKYREDQQRIRASGLDAWSPRPRNGRVTAAQELPGSPTPSGARACR